MSKKEFTFNSLACLINIFILAGGQQVAPGVNPNHYQQYQHHPEQQQYHQPPPPPQQYQQQPPPPQQQYQQPPPPPQQQYQQPPPPPPQQGGHGHGHHHDPQLLNTANIGQERDHIKEHLDVPIDTSKMTEKELHYHYFTMHDADKNNKLDGCELIKSLIHWHDGEDNKEDHNKPMSDEELSTTVDHALKSFDLDNDGFISYSEYSMNMQEPIKETS